MEIADKIISSEAVFTGLENEAKPAALAIKGNKILAVGAKEEILSYIGSETKEYHFGNQLIMPGFHDAHLHLMLGSLFTHASVDLSGARSSEEVVTLVKRFADERQGEKWIFGYGWDQTKWAVKEFPKRFLLDKAIHDRPVILFHAEGHYTWVNSKALQVSGVTKKTANPDYGVIEKDDEGELTGILIETATNLVADIALALPEEKQRELFEAFLKQAARLGVTSVNDLYASSFDRLKNLNMYHEYDKNGKLTTRIHLYPALSGNIEEAKATRDTYRSEKLRFTGLKQFIDGVVTGHTAYMLDPYLDRPETKGGPAFPEETIRNWVLTADREGFQIRFHAIGDGAVRLGLDLFEEAQQINGIRDSRHALEHIEVIHPTDIPRFKEIGVIPSVQPSHLALMPKESHTLRVGKEKAPYTYLCRTLKDAVDHIAFGTDYPITTLNPFKEIYYAVTRVDFTGESKWNKKEQVTLADALRAYTQGAAYSSFRENELGTLEGGKLADIIVLDCNLFDISVDQIPTIQVELTMMDGEVIYLSSAEDSPLHRCRDERSLVSCSEGVQTPAEQR
ncbi:amidohydrolase [Sporosarcina sp. ACRSM]|uniref:amidohydrolase n=1 Tax=Sporosarcina sp. ACRSM TaxID=2918216 RepID=UPI001EF53316|nr:amidohydrolase [Sporosarcina sp. ACRSM]MCG7334749.1 amidohydrolase [Sporosarcina sp. ACRSM]